MNWSGRHVVLGVSGGIASYKSCYLARRLTEAGARVDVILTEGAAAFVRPVVFEALTGRPVVTSLWDRDQALAHIRLARDPDLIIIAPATAHLLARAALGLADDFLTTMLLARTAPVLLAPAMNDEMFAHPETGANLERLRARGVAVVGPDTGPLAEGESDRPGRMSEPEVILAHAARLLRGRGKLAGRNVVVTAGPTREALDPVRFISNRSSGKMGFALASAAWERGAVVTLITGPTALPDPDGVTVVRVESTADLAREVGSALPRADALIMAAAPADFRPRQAEPVKRPRAAGSVALELESTPDVLLGTMEARKRGAVIVGFALETGSAVEKAREKLVRKALDLIVVNDATEAGAGFEVDTNRVTILSRSRPDLVLPLLSKAEVAEQILDAVEQDLD